MDFFGLVFSDIVALFILIALFITFAWLPRVFKRHFISLSPIQRHSLKDLFILIFKNKEIRRRVLITIGILIILRIMFFIPLPGINISALQDFSGKIQNPSFLTKIELFTKMVRGLTIFSLGLMPFFSACLLLQLGSVFIPSLRRFTFGGEQGRNRLLRYTYILTILLSIFYAYILTSWIFKLSTFKEVNLVMLPAWQFRLITIPILVGAVILLLFIADIITKYGIGNGVAVIAVSYFPIKLLLAAKEMPILYFQIKQISDGIVYSLIILLILLILFIGIIWGSFYFTRMGKIIKIRNKNFQENFIYLRPTIVGYIPLEWTVGWTNTIIFLSMTYAPFLKSSLFVHFLIPIIKCVLIFVLTYVYALIVFKPKYIQNLLKTYGVTVIEEDNRFIERFLKYNLKKVLVFTGLFLIGAMFLPDLITYLLKIPSYAIVSLFDWAVFIPFVGVISDIIQQLEFFKDKESSGIKTWSICYIALGENEAEIKRAYLASQGIPSLIEPLRFSWGMPVRTVVDQYRIYVPKNKKEIARNLILKLDKRILKTKPIYIDRIIFTR